MTLYDISKKYIREQLNKIENGRKRIAYICIYINEGWTNVNKYKKELSVEK